MNVDLAKATEAAAHELFDEEANASTDPDGWPEYADLDPENHWAYLTRARAVLDAAYPHVFAAVVEALRARAEAEFSGPEYDGADVSYPNPAHWLARIAQEGQP